MNLPPSPRRTVTSSSGGGTGANINIIGGGGTTTCCASSSSSLSSSSKPPLHHHIFNNSVLPTTCTSSASANANATTKGHSSSCFKKKNNTYFSRSHHHHHHHHRFFNLLRTFDRFSFFMGVVIFGFSLEMWITFTQQVPALTTINTSTPETISILQQQQQQQQQQPTRATRTIQQQPFEATKIIQPRVVSLVDHEEDNNNNSDRNIFPSSSSSWFRRITTKTITGQRQRTVEPLSTSSSSSCSSHCNDKGMDSHIYEYEKPYYQQCVPMKEWQTQSFPTCNSVHEIGISQFGTPLSLFSLQGSWRSVWKWDNNNNNETAVLKLLKFDKRRFDHESYNYHRIDALAMERLTSSRHIINLYGYCGQTTVTEYATGNGRMFVKDKNFGSLERLKLGRDIVRAFVDIHSIDYPNSTNATLAHNDINMANIVEVNGRIVLNDFNIGVLMRWNNSNSNNNSTGTGTPCGYPVRFKSQLWKSPEEIANVSYIDPAMADMYGLGNLLFQIMTKHQPWTHLEPNGPINKHDVAKLKLNGTTPYVPMRYSMSNKTAIQVLYYATMSCFRYEPSDRLTSYELLQRLNLLYELIKSRHYSIPRNGIKQLFEKNMTMLFTKAATTTSHHHHHDKHK